MRWYLDSSAPDVGIVLGVCKDCDFRGFACSEDQALERLRLHAIAFHPGCQQISDAIRKRRTRRATRQASGS